MDNEIYRKIIHYIKKIVLQNSLIKSTNIANIDH